MTYMHMHVNGFSVLFSIFMLRAQPVSAQATRIGTVGETPAALVTLQSRIGTKRVLDMLSGEQLPRIC